MRRRTPKVHDVVGLHRQRPPLSTLTPPDRPILDHAKALGLARPTQNRVAAP